VGMVPKNRQCKYFIYNRLEHIFPSPKAQLMPLRKISRYTNILSMQNDKQTVYLSVRTSAFRDDRDPSLRFGM
jgi:hypothetical protein